MLPTSFPHRIDYIVYGDPGSQPYHALICADRTPFVEWPHRTLAFNLSLNKVELWYRLMWPHTGCYITFCNSCLDTYFELKEGAGLPKNWADLALLGSTKNT